MIDKVTKLDGRYPKLAPNVTLDLSIVRINHPKDVQAVVPPTILRRESYSGKTCPLEQDHAFGSKDAMKVLRLKSTIAHPARKGSMHEVRA